MYNYRIIYYYIDINKNIYTLTISSHKLLDKILMRYGVVINLHTDLISMTDHEWLKYKEFYIDLFTRISSFLTLINSNRCEEAQTILNYILDKDRPENEENEVYIKLLWNYYFRFYYFIKERQS